MRADVNIHTNIVTAARQDGDEHADATVNVGVGIAAADGNKCTNDMVDVSEGGKQQQS